jgi:hypothetical protein
VSKSSVIFLVVAALLAGAVFFKLDRKADQPEDEFCIQVITEARNPETGIITDFPTPCDVPEGWEIIEPPAIIYENASADMIEIELPYPGAVVGKEFSVIGRARGSWFFEASFPIDLLDADGQILAQSYAMTAEEWMTTDFVSFRGEIKAPQDYIGPATLILMKDNPSGEPQFDASVSFPIVVEY